MVEREPGRGRRVGKGRAADSPPGSTWRCGSAFVCGLCGTRICGGLPGSGHDHGRDHQPGERGERRGQVPARTVPSHVRATTGQPCGGTGECGEDGTCRMRGTREIRKTVVEANSPSSRAAQEGPSRRSLAHTPSMIELCYKACLGAHIFLLDKTPM